MAGELEGRGLSKEGEVPAAGQRAVRTLLVSDLVGSTALVERLGDVRAGEVFRHHDRLARDLLDRHGGLEIDKADGFLLLFERPWDAVRYALAYHQGLRRLSEESGLELFARVGIHLGEVYLIRNAPGDVARGAKPVEVEGLAKPFAARLMSVALGGQTLLTRATFDVARRAAVGDAGAKELQWLAHGRYSLKGVDDPVEVYEVGLEGESPLRPPEDSEKVKRLSAPSASSGEKRRRALEQVGDLVGKKLGDFRIERLIGAGGMGVVYEAVDESLHRPVALKVLPADLTDDPRRNARFMREARSAAAVTHPCVATIYRVGADGARIYIAMELVLGQSLRDRLVAGPLPLAEALRIAVEISRGLARAHQVGVIHRDLKPDNVMLAQDGQVKLLDFGLAKPLSVKLPDVDSGEITAATEVGAEGRILGTPGYMSPEQCRGAAVEPRSDIFCFGALLYEMLTDARPFRGETVFDTLIATTRDPHQPVTELRPEVSEGLAALVDRCLEKAPADRFADARELLERLHQLAGLPTPSSVSGAALLPLPATATGAGLGPSSTDTAPPMPARASGRRRAVIAGALVVAVAAVAALGLVLARDHGCGGDAAPLSAPLAAENSVLACPVLEATGVEAPTGWLGATAAHIACERATVMLGGKTSRTLIPAQLLDLPGQLVDDFPRDPLSAPGAREKSIQAARQRASAWLDGRVEARRESFALELRLRDRDGRELAAARGEGHLLFQAVRAALDQLARAGALPRARRIVEEVARWTGVTDIDLALAVFDWSQNLSNDVGLKPEYDRLQARRQDLRLQWPLIRFFSAILLDGPFGPVQMPTPDSSSPTGRMWTALARSYAEPNVDRRALAVELAALRQQVQDRRGRAELTKAEARLRYQIGETERVRQLSLSVAAVNPRWAEWWAIAGAAYRSPGFEQTARAYAAWSPCNSDAWNMLGYGEPESTDAQRVAMMRRAVRLAPDLPLWNIQLSTYLIRARQIERARSLAARLSGGGPWQQSAAETILAKIDCCEGRFQAATTRARVALLKQKWFGLIEKADPHQLGIALAAAEVLGQNREVADAFAERFVLAKPHRLAPGHFVPDIVSSTCADASPEVAARCFSRLRELIEEGWFIEGFVATTDARLKGYERYARGDFAGAVAAWRPLVASGWAAPPRVSAAFDRVGEPELASRLDAKVLKAAPAYHGATMAHVREARRAAARGDAKQARALAKTVVEAWSVADARVPVVAEMRQLLRSLPGP